MLVVFSPIFVADTKIISRHDFVAPLILLHKAFATVMDIIFEANLWFLVK